MSGPFRFNQEQATSPLDRPPPNLFPAGQPPSFKTNVNRSKTKKWVEAKPYSYDGDDWGEYDEYDEYGTEQEPPPPPQSAAPTGLRQPGQRFEQPRSFTDPQRQGSSQLARRNSFEAGEEHRAFSASIPQPHGAPRQPVGPVHPANRQASATESDTSDTPQHRRDFLASALPHPLQTKASPASGSTTGPPWNPQYPARKSSIGQVDSPVPYSPRDRAPSNPTKALPFIRPADIYKRVEEERQRERSSMESSRPSLDSLSSRPREDVTSPRDLQERGSSDILGKNADASKSLHPLETVAERKSEYLPDFNVGARDQYTKSQPETSKSQQPSLPQIPGISAFDSDFWSSAPQSQNLASKTPVTSPPDDQGFRSVVSQAFNRSDDQRSVPPTPISKQSDSGVSRSNTDSTSGISPIMSRVPSSATSALKNRNNAGGDGSTPMIAEEASESSTPVSRPGSTAVLGAPYHIARKPSPSHSRNISSTSLPRTGVATPSPGESPARSPAIEPEKALPEPESALHSSLNPAFPEAMEGGLGGQSSAYATREADIASAMRMRPDKPVSELSAAEKESQDMFLESHANAQSPLSDAAPRSRSESPSKGRVQALAGKFGEVSQSRRGSTQSNASRNSVQSWERSRENSRPSSPTKVGANGPSSPTKEALSGRPTAAGREVSFRPKLPGQWESYATFQTSSDQGVGEKQLTDDIAPIPEGHQVSSPLEDVDLTPTTTKRPVSATDPSKSPSDTLAALKAAGTAMGEAIQASVGLGSSSSGNSRDPGAEVQGRSYGDIYLSRPLQLDRTESSASSIAPTPPAKDTPTFEFPPPPPSKEKNPESFPSSSQEETPVRPTIVPQLSIDPSEHDQESDRLRKEIVASLSPLRTYETTEPEPTRASLQPTVPPTTNRESSILPSEYDSYWADGDHVSPRPSNDLSRNAPEHPRSNTEQSPVVARSAAPPLPAPINPSLLTRFSWEDHASHHVSPDGQAQAGAGQTSKSPQDEKIDASPTAQGAAAEAPGQPVGGIPDSYFGPSHTVAVTKPDPVRQPDLAVRSPTPPPDAEKPVPSPARADTTNEAPHVSGLHVVNSALNPEAVDMPPRLSVEASPVSQEPRASQEDSAVPSQQQDQDLKAIAPVPVPAPGSSSGQEPATKSPTTDKPLGFRDIVTIKSPSERIATYNKTRDYWANTDHGLNDWIASAIAANPQLASQSLPQHRPQVAASATSRHKPTGSLSLFGKNKDPSSAQTASTPYYEQYNSAAAQVPPTPTSSGASADARPHGSSAGMPGGRSASHQMQTKGKDILHTAGVLGGKGMTSAKGLFAKGKSRFRASGGGDKAARSESMSSSREASEEPELVTTPERRVRMSIDFDSPKEEKKKRRLSSPFHRSSRSRSRPSSIILPKNAHLDFGHASTPRSTPPRETPPAEVGRPHSYHAPDSWDIMPDSQQSTGHSTPPRSGLQPPERLGVLPSPAKSAFSLLPQDRDSDIPPVPPIPDGVEERPRGREGQESASHRILQSIIRHSTPPVMERSVLQDSANFVSGSTTERESVKRDRYSSQQGGPKVLELEQTEEEDDDDGPPQLNHDPLPAKPLPQPLDQDSGTSPPVAPIAPTTGDISPVVSSVGPDGLDETEDEDDRPPQVVLDYLMPNPQHAVGNVSPMISVASLAVGMASDGPQTPVGNGASEARPAYETDLIGAGDVSPISSRAHSDEDATPTKVKADALGAPVARQTDKVAIEVETAPDMAAGGLALAPHANTAPPPGVATQQRLSASPYQVVHAVQYVPSHSSFESWEQDSVAAPSQSDGSQLGDRHEIPPVPQIPSVVLPEEKTEQALEPGQQPSNIATANANISVEEHPSRSDSIQQETQQPSMAETAKPGGNKRSQSLLSTISSMVSADRVPVSPTSSHTGRSRPSIANRQLPASSAKSPQLPVKVIEESASEEQSTMAASSNDDYDLYADHNGVVKDIRDERGQPLRVAAVPVPDVPKPTLPPEAEAVRIPDIFRFQEIDTTRFSFERPMSFVSGPRDANGRPQDEINRPGTTAAETDIPPVPQIPIRLQGKPQARPADTIHTETPPIQPDLQPNEERFQPRASDGNPGSQTVSPVQSSQHSRQITTPPHSNVSPPPPSNASPPPQSSPPPSLAQRPLLQDPRLSNVPAQDSRSQDPRMSQDPRNWDPRLMADSRMRGMIPGQPHPQNPRVQMQTPGQMYSQDPRTQGQPVGSPPVPRNQFELQQQLMQRQVIDTRLGGVEYRLPGAGPAQSSAHPAKQEEKPSYRPKLTSVLKGLSSKSHLSAPPSSNQPSNMINPSLTAPGDPNRSVSYQSSIGDLPTEQVTAKKESRSSAFGSSSNRPQSVGTESHTSQNSTRVQAVDSRLDLRHPASPAPFKGIPIHQPHSGASVPPKQPQSQRVPTSGFPESGKKKRLSALGNLFSRSGTTSHSIPTKTKLTKEEKKAQKAQKHATAPPIQSPPLHQWSQQQQHPRPQQYGVQNGLRPAAVRPFPGVQGIALQTMPPQTMSLMSPQGLSSQGMPQHLMQSQAYQQQQQHHHQRPGPDGSAYMATRQIAQAHQSQWPIPHSSQSTQGSHPGVPAPNPSFERTVQWPGEKGPSPPNEYYIPDSKRLDHEYSPPGFTAIEQQHAVAPQHPSNLRRVSSPASTHGSNGVSPISQRRVSSPPTEPQYETPQIPAAYNHVTGAYTSPGIQAPVHNPQTARPSAAQYHITPGRQYSDPQMQPISPQVSAQSQVALGQRTHSDSSTASVVSPVSNPSPGMSTVHPVSNQRPQKPRMTSISEATHQEHPWNLNLREGATEQEIVRARHQQYMEQQLAAQQQLHAERTGQSPSPRLSHHTQSPSPKPPPTQQQPHQPHPPPPTTAGGAGGFREVLPRSSSQPYPSVPSHISRDQQQLPAPSSSPHPLQPAPIHPDQPAQPAYYPLPMSPDSTNTRSPVNPLADALPPPPPPKISHNPMRPIFSVNQSYLGHIHQQQGEEQPQQYQPPPFEEQSNYGQQQQQQPEYEQPLDEPPPSYSGPGVPNEGMDKERPRPPNIVIDAEIQNRERDTRQRQPSIGILQHPQPASMAASPQSSSADMGADILRRQLLVQEERARAERQQRAEMQRAETQRERQERERARARARELERSVSGGGRVGSLRSAAGSGSGNGLGWERRGSTARPVFELPAEEDDEPVMRATSFPGQEWVPTWTED